MTPDLKPVRFRAQSQKRVNEPARAVQSSSNNPKWGTVQRDNYNEHSRNMHMHQEQEHNKINVHCVVQVHMLQLSCREREGGHLESSGELSRDIVTSDKWHSNTTTTLEL